MTSHMNDKQERKIKLDSGGYLLLCLDHEHCTLEHNDIECWTDEYHHYGCDCWACMEFYRSLK